MSKGVNKLEWSFDYLRAIAPYAAAVKPNFQYWKNMDSPEAIEFDNGMDGLRGIVDEAHDLGLVVIDDSKLADIGSTNDAGMFYSAQKGFDAVTIAPYAGNMGEAIKMGHKRGLGVIPMVLMGNPEYGFEKNKLVPVSKVELERFYPKFSEIRGNIVDGQFHTFQYLHLASRAYQHGADGIVIGAPSECNQIRDVEIGCVQAHAGSNMLVLLSGVGAQGGEAGAIWEHYDSNRVIVNVGMSLMFPEGSDSTSEDHVAAAKHYQEMFNGKRAG